MNSTIASRLTSERKRLNWKQEMLAAHCGITSKSIQNYESGAHKPSVQYITSLLNLGADAHYILTGDSPNEAALEKAKQRSDFANEITAAVVWLLDMQHAGSVVAYADSLIAQGSAKLALRFAVSANNFLSASLFDLQERLSAAIEVAAVEAA